MEQELNGTPAPTKKPRQREAAKASHSVSLQVNREWTDAPHDLMVTIPTSRFDTLKIHAVQNELLKQPNSTMASVVLLALDEYFEKREIPIIGKEAA